MKVAGEAGEGRFHDHEALGMEVLGHFRRGTS